MFKDQPTVSEREIYLRIKQKRERHAEKANRNQKITGFNVGDLVMVRACRTSDAQQKVMSKFCDIYEGPYRVVKKISLSTYQLEHLHRQEMRGIFNTRQLKAYHRASTNEISPWDPLMT
jgi:hypothetical protein